MTKVVDFYVVNDWPRERHQTHNKEPSMTRQEFKEECDINTLMSKFDQHVVGGPGGLPHMTPEAMYVDLTYMPTSLMEYYEYMFKAESAFMSLPAVVRKEFDNDPKMFADFASEPENLGQMRTWGLAAPEAPPERLVRVEVVSTGGSSGGVGATPPPSTHGST